MFRDGSDDVPTSLPAEAEPALPACARPELMDLHEAYCIAGFHARRFTHEELWSLLGRVVDGAPGLSRQEIGASAEGRPLYAVRFGSGPVPVLMWSQMHGDEPAHTMALADLLCWVGREPDDERVRRIADALTVYAVPMLNPDGAGRFQRPNAQGIDLNRDARVFATPEMRALRELFHHVEPAWALNLHDQNVRKRVGTSERMTAYALLACPVDEEGTDTEARRRAKHLCAAVRNALDPIARDRIARFAEEYEPTGMGEYSQRAGTATMLLEAGFWPRDPEKQFLRRLGFTAIVTALEAIADGSWQRADVCAYEELPENAEDVFDVLVRGGTVVVPGLEPYRADLGITFRTPLDLEDGTLADLGDLAGYGAREVIDAEGLFIHPAADTLASADGAPPVLHTGCPATLALRRGPDPASEAVFLIERGVVTPAAAPARQAA